MVEAGQTVCIVEAMKLMNEVAAGEGGRRVARSSEDGEPVEFEQVLMYLEPAEDDPARVREGPDRQPRRDRAARGARLPRAGREVGGGLLDRRRRVGVVRFADEAVCIGPPAAGKSYLHIPNIIGAAEKTGAEAIHPGYGFLSEDPYFAEICTDNGITFIGPKPEVMEKGGRQGRSRAT